MTTAPLSSAPLVLPSFRHPLIDVLIIDPARGIETLCEKFPFLARPTPQPCTCTGKYLPDALLTFHHLWDTHVIQRRDWTEQQVSAWLFAAERGS